MSNIKRALEFESDLQKQLEALGIEVGKPDPTTEMLRAVEAAHMAEVYEKLASHAR